MRLETVRQLLEDPMVNFLLGVVITGASLWWVEKILKSG